MPIVTVPRVLREKLRDDGADALVGLINEATVDQRNETLAIIEEKFERRLAEEIGEAKVELIRWMFIFWVGQIGVLTGILFAFLR